MKTVTLNNGTVIPQVGVGTWTLKGETATNDVCKALKAGFRLVDTAQMYGNEEEVGRGIMMSGLDRKDVFLATKVNTVVMREGEKAVRNSIDESIRKLDVDYLDLLLIHWPVEGRVGNTWRVMEEYCKKGLVRNIGVSNFNRRQLDELMEYAEIHPAVNQIEVHPYMSQVEEVEYNLSLGIAVEGWGPFGQGDNNVVNDPVLKQLAVKYAKTSGQIVLRWLLQRGLIVIPRCRPNHFMENLELTAFSLAADDMAAIYALNKNQRSDPRNDPENFAW